MAQTTFSARMDEDLKQEFDAFCAETVAALEESEEMLKNPSKYKRYATFRDALNEVLNE